MIEIIPNWHPLFVHFTVALFSSAVGFYGLAYLASQLSLPIAKELEIASRWCLWAAGMITIFTVIAGFSAYNIVQHDAPSHAAMTEHRNWALPTAGFILLLTIWSCRRFQRQKPLSVMFLITLLLGQGLLLSTAWRGAELVFRYGIGVMSLPKIENHHQHNNDTTAESYSKSISSDEHKAHPHAHDK